MGGRGVVAGDDVLTGAAGEEVPSVGAARLGAGEESGRQLRGAADEVVVADCGLPVPPGPEVVDLAFTFGVPTFLQVLDGLLAEIVVEDATVAREVDDANPLCAAAIRERPPDQCPLAATRSTRGSAESSTLWPMVASASSASTAARLSSPSPW